jgi:hypothetical protein
VKFRKKPLVIEAEQFWDMESRRPSAVFASYNCVHAHWRGGGETCVEQGPHVHTLEGPLRVSPGDWIITGIKGERYPCKPDIFEATYEAVEE